MSDREFGSSDDLSLPKATVQKILGEILPASSGVTTSKEFRDAIADCCVEFVTLIASEANEISEREAKKTIACEHVTAALKELGFPEYIEAVQASADEFKKQQAGREKKQNKLEQSGKTEEQLMQEQQEFFMKAAQKFNTGPANEIA